VDQLMSADLRTWMSIFLLMAQTIFQSLELHL